MYYIYNTCSTENLIPDSHLAFFVSYSLRSERFLKAISAVPSYNNAKTFPKEIIINHYRSKSLNYTTRDGQYLIIVIIVNKISIIFQSYRLPWCVGDHHGNLSCTVGRDRHIMLSA